MVRQQMRQVEAQMVQKNVTGRGIDYCPDVVVGFPREFSDVEISHGISTDKEGFVRTTEGEKIPLEQIIENMVRAINISGKAKNLLFSEGVPRNIKLSRFMGTEFFDELAQRAGYDVNQRGNGYGTYYGLFAITDEIEKRNKDRVYRRAPNEEKTVTITDNLKEGYSGDGIILIPVPKNVVENVGYKIPDSHPALKYGHRVKNYNERLRDSA